MKLLGTILLVALAQPVGVIRQPMIAQQQPTMTVTVTLAQHVDVFQNASQIYTLTNAPAPSTRKLVQSILSEIGHHTSPPTSRSSSQAEPATER